MAYLIQKVKCISLVHTSDFLFNFLDHVGLCNQGVRFIIKKAHINGYPKG